MKRVFILFILFSIINLFNSINIYQLETYRCVITNNPTLKDKKISKYAIDTTKEDETLDQSIINLLEEPYKTEFQEASFLLPY